MAKIAQEILVQIAIIGIRKLADKHFPGQPKRSTWNVW